MSRSIWPHSQLRGETAIRSKRDGVPFRRLSRGPVALRKTSSGPRHVDDIAGQGCRPANLPGRAPNSPAVSLSDWLHDPWKPRVRWYRGPWRHSAMATSRSSASRLLTSVSIAGRVSEYSHVLREGSDGRELAELFYVSLPTVWRWRSEHQEFSDAMAAVPHRKAAY